MAEAYAKEKRWHEAEKCYRKVIEEQPKNPDINHKLAEVLQEIGNFDEAITYYKKSIQLKPEVCFAYRGLGDVFCKQGKLDESIAAYQESLTRKPDYKLAQDRLKQVLEKQTQLKEVDALTASSERLLAFKDKHRGERCVIIGNGPSLNRMDLSFLKHEICFGMNRIYLGFDKLGCIPTYYASVNRLVIEQSTEEILKIPRPKFLSNKAISYLPNREDLIFIKTYPYEGDFFSTNPQQGLKEGNTVTYYAMQLAYYMGFETVILIGVDHHFVTQGKAHKEVVSEGDDPNHFHPGYFGKGTKWHLPDLEGSEQFYRIANAYFRADGRQVIDATFEGKCTIFPKADYRDIFFYQSHKKFWTNATTPGKLQENKVSISVVLFVEDQSTHLQECLNSLVSQKYEIFEILVVDSRQNEKSQADTISTSEPVNIRYINSEQKGKLAAYNQAIQEANGEFILFVDEESFLLPNTLKLLANVEQLSSLDIVLSGWQELRDKTIVDITPWTTLPDLDNWHICKLWKSWRLFSQAPAMFRLSKLRDYGEFDTRLSLKASKVDLILRLLSGGCQANWLYKANCRRFQISEDILTHHFSNPDEVSLVLDNFFSQKNLEPGVSLLEPKARYLNLVWLAWLMYQADSGEEMIKYLLQSLNYVSNSWIYSLLDWVNKFVIFSKESGNVLDVELLTSSDTWENLVDRLMRLANNKVSL